MKNTMKTIGMMVLMMVLMMFYSVKAEAKHQTIMENTMVKTWVESINENKDTAVVEIWKIKTDNLIENQIEKIICNAKEYKDIAILKEIAHFATQTYYNTKDKRYLPYVTKSYDKIFEIEAKLYYRSILENQEEYGVTIKRIGNTIYADFGNRGTVIFVFNPENEIVSMHS